MAKGMRILIATPHFYPESFKCNDLAFELQRRGHDVTVMTAIPDYPKGKFFEEYGIFKKRKEVINGVKVHRSLIIPRGKGSNSRLILNYISYTFFSILRGIRFAFGTRFDMVFVFQLSPVMVGIPATIIKKKQKIPMLFCVQDLWPESLSSAGGIKNKLILKTFGKLTTYLYKNSNKILISSEGFRNSITKKGDFNDKIRFFPNWIDKIDKSIPDNCCLPKLPDGFIVMYAGNIGDAQDIQAIIKSAELLRDNEKIKFVFLGDGRMKGFLVNEIQRKDLGKTVSYMGRYPLETMPYFLSKANVLLLSLKDTEIFSLTVPSRLQAFMAAGKPVVGMINGEGAEVIKKANCGFSVSAGDSNGLADMIVKMAQMNKDKLEELGENGMKFAIAHYDFNKSIDYLEELMEGI